MKNFKKLVYLAAGGLGLCAFAMADPHPVSTQFVNYTLSTSLVGVNSNMLSSGVTGTFQFGPLNLPNNYTNFQLINGVATESFNEITQTLTATYPPNLLGGPMGYTYDSAATTSPGNILTPGKDANGSFVEFKPTDPIFTPVGTKYFAQVNLEGVYTHGVGAGHLLLAAAPGVTTALIDNPTSTTLFFEQDSVSANFAPSVDVKFYTNTPSPDPAVYMGLGIGLVGLFVRKRRAAAAA